jgi:TrkA domain protein
MAEIQETQLPGVGVRHDFVTKAGERIGMISHRTGRRDLLIYDRNDPDACEVVVRLEEQDIRILADLLGAATVTERLTKLQQSVEGLTIDWVPIGASWAYAGHTIQETQLRAQTGVTIIAVIRDEQTTPAPGPDFQLQAGDTVVVIGTPEGIHKAFALLQGGVV